MGLPSVAGPRDAIRTGKGDLCANRDKLIAAQVTSQTGWGKPMIVVPKSCRVHVIPSGLVNTRPGVPRPILPQELLAIPLDIKEERKDKLGSIIGCPVQLIPSGLVKVTCAPTATN